MRVFSKVKDEISEGLLVCNCGRSYPIVNTIPRVLPDAFDEHPDFMMRHQSEIEAISRRVSSKSAESQFSKLHGRTKESFEYQWMRFEVQDVDKDEAVFVVKTGSNPADLRGRLVLDAGCGGGRYTYVVGQAGAEVVAVDLSRAVEKTKQVIGDMSNVHIVQANLMELPFREESFDYIFSIGVLHHTPDTKKSFNELTQHLKPTGTIAIWVYRKNTLLQELINSGLRKLTIRLPFRILYYLAWSGAVLGGVPVIKHLSRIIPFSIHPNWQVRICDTFDWYSPQYQHHHIKKEVMDWFVEKGFTDIEILQPSKSGRLYNWAYEHNLLVGSGISARGVKRCR